jgi:hypothetical protein
MMVFSIKFAKCKKTVFSFIEILVKCLHLYIAGDNTKKCNIWEDNLAIFKKRL